MASPLMKCLPDFGNGSHSIMPFSRSTSFLSVDVSRSSSWTLSARSPPNCRKDKRNHSSFVAFLTIIFMFNHLMHLFQSLHDNSPFGILFKSCRYSSMSSLGNHSSLSRKQFVHYIHTHVCTKTNHTSTLCVLCRG